MLAEKLLSIPIRISLQVNLQSKIILSKSKSDRISQLADGPIPQLFTLGSSNVNNTEKLVSALPAKVINFHNYVLKK